MITCLFAQFLPWNREIGKYESFITKHVSSIEHCIRVMWTTDIFSNKV
jgi:hypothetical protein